MKIKYLSLFLLALLSNACISQGGKDDSSISDNSKKIIHSQIAQYVVDVFEDSNGNLWFGTLENGVAKYDGNTLWYFTQADGLPSNRVTSMVEDVAGNLWFGTGRGLSKYDGNTFTNLSKKDGLCSNSVSNIFIDSKGLFWIGTWGGVCQFDGKEFAPVSLHNPTIDTPINEDTKNWITEINEDAKGNIWIARDGYGAYKYDGESFDHILKADGLHSNNVTEIEFDHLGNTWFGTRVAERDHPNPTKRFGKGGVNRMDDQTIISFPDIEEFNNGDVYSIYRDLSDNIWIGTVKKGVYKYDGKEFIHYDVPTSVMSMVEDKKGIIWLGSAGGLYKINLEGEVINVTTNGPWK